MAVSRNIRSIRAISHQARAKGGFPWILLAFNVLFCVVFFLKYVRCFRR